MPSLPLKVSTALVYGVVGLALACGACMVVCARLINVYGQVREARRELAAEKAQATTAAAARAAAAAAAERKAAREAEAEQSRAAARERLKQMGVSLGDGESGGGESDGGWQGAGGAWHDDDSGYAGRARQQHR